MEEKKFKVTIWHPWPKQIEETEMTLKEIKELRRSVAKWVKEHFKWEDYDPYYKHLVYCVKFKYKGETEPEYYVYPYGTLYEEWRYDENIVNRPTDDLTILRDWTEHKVEETA